jgi:ABC-type antimicrobial peptide transport system permease subunit
MIWMILRQVLTLGIIGLIIGIVTARGASRLIESFLYDIKPNSPIAIATAAAILLSAILLAGYIPARRASRIDPIIAVRHE